MVTIRITGGNQTDTFKSLGILYDDNYFVVVNKSGGSKEVAEILLPDFVANSIRQAIGNNPNCENITVEGEE